MSERIKKVLDKVVSVNERNSDRTDEMTDAANTALYFPSEQLDMVSQFDALVAFDQSIRGGESVNQALSQATDPIRTEVTIKTGDGFAANRAVAEIGVRFWDAMGPHEEGEEPAPAIERALDGYAPDGGSWLEAKAAFTDAIQRGVKVDIALDIALDTIKEGTETHPEVAKDRFYAGIDPNYAENEHVGGRKVGLRVEVGGKRIEVGVGHDVQKKRQRHLGHLAAQHNQDTE